MPASTNTVWGDCAVVSLECRIVCYAQPSFSSRMTQYYVIMLSTTGLKQLVNSLVIIQAHVHSCLSHW